MAYSGRRLLVPLHPLDMRTVGFVDWDLGPRDFDARRRIGRKSAAVIFPPLDFGNGIRRRRWRSGITIDCGKAENGDVRH